MESGYIVEAYSPSLNQAHRQFNLHNLSAPTDAAAAQRDADVFAESYNRDRKMHVTDWIGRITWQDFGISTIPGFIKR